MQAYHILQRQLATTEPQTTSLDLSNNSVGAELATSTYARSALLTTKPQTLQKFSGPDGTQTLKVVVLYVNKATK